MHAIWTNISLMEQNWFTNDNKFNRSHLLHFRCGHCQNEPKIKSSYQYILLIFSLVKSYQYSYSIFFILTLTWLSYFLCLLTWKDRLQIGHLSSSIKWFSTWMVKIWVFSGVFSNILLHTGQVNLSFLSLFSYLLPPNFSTSFVKRVSIIDEI